MELQTKLEHSIIQLRVKNNYLENEKDNLLINLCNLLDLFDFEKTDVKGRPRSNFRDILKTLCIMSYQGLSYRRIESEIRDLHRKGIISQIPTRCTLNNYFNDEQTKLILERLIQASSLFFQENEDTIIMDSTWLATRMYSGGYRKVHDKKNVNFNQTRKLHISCLKNSKVICCAITTEGKKHDCPFFKELLTIPIHNGFNIKTVLADSGYMSKENYALCKELGANNVFIDFKPNITGQRAKSDLWRERVKMWKEQKEVWKESYRFRVIVEGVFSTIKRKNLNWLRSKKEISQDVELLLKCLVYNLTLIGKYS